MTELQGNGFYVECLDSHGRSSFSCGVEELDTYLKTRAGQDARKKVAAPFVVIDESNGAIAGFYEHSSEVAAFAVVVDAKHGAEGFYLKYGFVPFADDNYRLFLPMKTIEALIKGS